MIALLLGVYALLVGRYAPRVLLGAWIYQSPRLAMLTWLSVIGTTFSAILLSGLVLTTAALPSGTSVLGVVRACMEVGAWPSDRGGSFLTAMLGLSITAFITTRAGLTLHTLQARACGERDHQRAALSLLAARNDAWDALVLPHDAPAAFCMPGRRAEVVITSGAMTRLTAAQLEGVLAHERAHVRGRHHLILTVAEALATALPWLPCFGVAHRELRALLEMRADEVALRSCHRFDLALALLEMSQSRTPVGVLAAAAHATADRVRRLADPPHPLSTVVSYSSTGLLALVLLSPLLITTGPAAVALTIHYCVGVMVGL